MRLASGPTDTELSVAIDVGTFKNGPVISSSTYTQVGFTIASVTGTSVTATMSGHTVNPGFACFDVDDIVIRRVQ